MLIVEKSDQLKTLLSLLEVAGIEISFVPTMGAIHKGHLSLIKKAGQSSGLVVCSIFVNPTQFNKAEDLESYPVQTESDIELLKASGCDILFLPEIDDIYPNGKEYTLSFDPGYLGDIMEGQFRPGHFKGVAQVVHRLLELIQPDKLYMGEKDFQQLAVIRKMISDLNLGVMLIPCPTLREADGLAMSSRNQRLSPEYRKRASAIYNTLVESKNNLNHLKASEVKAIATNQLSDAGLKPEYFELVDPINLLPLSEDQSNGAVQACTAVWAGEVRLIDNMIVRK